MIPRSQHGRTTDMPVILKDEAIKLVLDALSPDATDEQRASVREQLVEAVEIGTPDEIDLYRIMKNAERRRRIDMARQVQKELFGENT
jgi:hypothetical protein